MLYHLETSNLFETVADFRSENPLTSFGPLVSDAELASVGLVNLVDVHAPGFDPMLHDEVLQGIAQVDGVWLATYGHVDKPMPTEQRMAIVVQRCDEALTAHLEATAKARRWDGRISLAVRAGYPNPWQQEAIAFGTWMDACNALAYQLMADVQAGRRPLPASPKELIDLLPPMVWPGSAE